MVSIQKPVAFPSVNNNQLETYNGQNIPFTLVTTNTKYFEIILIRNMCDQNEENYKTFLEIYKIKLELEECTLFLEAKNGILT